MSPAFCVRSVRTWLRGVESVERHMVPLSLNSLQSAMATFIHLMELTQLMGVPARATLRDFDGATSSKMPFNWEAQLANDDRQFWFAARIDQTSTWSSGNGCNSQQTSRATAAICPPGSQLTFPSSGGSEEAGGELLLHDRVMLFVWR